MPAVLICALGRNVETIQRTLLGRRDVERSFATSAAEALEIAAMQRMRLVLVDRDLPEADRLVARFRAVEGTRQASIVVVSSAGTEVPVQFGEAGANATLHLPAGPEWDEKLARLLAVPPRREVRLPVEITLQGTRASAQGIVHNLSRMGMLLLSSTEMDVGSDLEFAFDLGTGPPVCGRGRVVRAAGSGLWGVEFVLFEGLGGARVSTYVSTRRSGSPEGPPPPSDRGR